MKTIYDISSSLWFSGFCLTDNEHFSEFYLNRIPKLGYQYKKFSFYEKDLKFEKGNKVEVIKKFKGRVFFDDFSINFIFFNYFILKYGKGVEFYFINSFLGQMVNGMIGIFHNDRLIGLLKGDKNHANTKICSKG